MSWAGEDTGVVGVHVADPRRLAALLLIVLLLVAVVLALSTLTAPEPVPVGRS
ncbi:MAG: hypothetical protein KatS3mg014_0782 [Actinomycetota bacterium]|nr:MAG: hypothetical protein KatS3mg014_0782 [Actinomycetota bacterium]